MVIGGLDLSKNHYAMILKDLETQEYQQFIGWPVLGVVKKWEKKFPLIAFHYLPNKNKKEGETQEHFDTERGLLLTKCIENDISNFLRVSSFANMANIMKEPIIIALEGYAYGAFRSIDLAEVTGVVKQMLYQAGCAIRIHDPQSIKLWAGKGNYDKRRMVKEARHHISIPEEFSASKSPDNWIATDVADAFFLKTMIEWEVKIRKDPTKLEYLSESQLQVINRVTKVHKVNLLNRDFLAIEQPKLKSGIRRLE